MEQVVPPFAPEPGQVEKVSLAAIDWAIECGLSMPLGAAVEIRDFGFQIQVSEMRGKERCANIRFNRKGERQMFERAK